MPRIAYKPNDIVKGTLIISRTENNEYHTAVWNCKCTCGKLFKATSSKIRKNIHGPKCHECTKKIRAIGLQKKRFTPPKPQIIGCNECGHIGDRNLDFPINGRGHKRRICKTCWSKKTSHDNRLRAANKAPEKYLSCYDCGEVFSIFQQGRPRKNGFRKLAIECPYCKSEEIERFVKCE